MSYALTHKTLLAILKFNPQIVELKINLVTDEMIDINVKEFTSEF